MRNIAFETNRLKGISIQYYTQKYGILGRIMCNLYTTSFLPLRVISSLLPIFLQLSCLARCFIRSENPLNFLRKFANLINDGAKILTLFTTKRKKRRSLEKKLYSVPVFFSLWAHFQFPNLKIHMIWPKIMQLTQLQL